jgi:hypothetical protein
MPDNIDELKKRIVELEKQLAETKIDKSGLVQTNFRGDDPDEIYEVTFNLLISVGVAGHSITEPVTLGVYGNGLTVDTSDVIDSVADMHIYEHIMAYIDFEEPVDV